MAAVAALAVVQQQHSDTFRSGYIMAEVAIVAIVKQQHSDKLNSSSTVTLLEVFIMAVVAIVKQQRSDFLRSGNYNSIGRSGSCTAAAQ